ncbi:MAG: serine/threonine-protein kinase [Polyangiales bacterium]
MDRWTNKAMTEEAAQREYRTVGILAKGGMGQVELAVRVRANFQRLYAVKRLRPEFRSNNEFRLMFLDEGRIAGLLRHPNIVSVLDVGEDDAGPYLVMELVDGLNCSAFIAGHRSREQAIPEQIVLRIVQGVALGLAAAHRQVGLDGTSLVLIHRDVSPQNILVDFDGAVKVTDFGIAKAFGRLAETTTGLLKGKAGYMSPEQLRFEDLDLRSDLFSLGVVFFELLAGTRLYRRDTATEVARAILAEPPPDIMSIRPDTHTVVCELLFELLAKKPEYRPAGADEVAERIGLLLEELVADEGEMNLREYMTTVFGDEHTASVARQRSLLLDADVSSSATPRSPVSKHPRFSRSAVIAFVLILCAAALISWNAFRVPGSEGVVEEVADASADSVLSPAQPSPIAPEPSAEPVQIAGERAIAEDVLEPPTETATKRRRRSRRRTPMNRVVTNSDSMNASDGVADENTGPPPRTMVAPSREPGERARSHAVAF